MQEKKVKTKRLIPIDTGDLKKFKNFFNLFQENPDIKTEPPPIVVECPNRIGFYFFYDGTHRSAAKHFLGMKIQIWIIENDEDINFLKENFQVYSERLIRDKINTKEELINYCQKHNSIKYSQEKEFTNLDDWYQLTKYEEHLRALHLNYRERPTLGLRLRL